MKHATTSVERFLFLLAENHFFVCSLLRAVAFWAMIPNFISATERGFLNSFLAKERT
jgi:hypothetical protein